MRKLRVLDLFSGIGGFSLGLERTGGFETVAFCEIEDYPRRVLAKHWPHVPIYDDVRTLTADALSRDGIAVDVICGGFPCQDISFAGKGAGLAGERSGLWRDYARLIRELRPRFVLVENVAALLGRGLADVLGDLATLGYDAEWHCIPAAAVGAPHRRDRLWIVAYPGGQQHEGNCSEIGRALAAELYVADAEAMQWAALIRREQNGDHAGAGAVANADDARLEGRDGRKLRQRRSEWTARPSSPSVGDPACELLDRGWSRSQQRWSRQSSNAGWWLTEPDVGRVANGVPSRVDRLRGLGNAVVPQIPELIGRAILKAEGIAIEAMEAAHA